MSENLSQVSVVELVLGGHSFQGSSGEPQAIQNFTCNWVGGNGLAGNDVQFTLYHHIDPYNSSANNVSSDNINFIGSLLGGSYLSPQLFYFRYGYNYVTGNGGHGEIMTPRYRLMLTGASFKLFPSGIRYDIKGVSSLCYSAVEGIKTYNWAADRDGRIAGKLSDNPTGEQLCNRIKLTIKYIMNQYGYSVQWKMYEPKTYATEFVNKESEALSILSQQSGDASDVDFAKSLLKYLQYNESDNVYYTNYNATLKDYASGPVFEVYPTIKVTVVGSNLVKEFIKWGGHKTYIWNGNPSQDSTGFGGRSILETDLDFDILVPSSGATMTQINDNAEESRSTALIPGIHSGSYEANIALSMSDYENMMGQMMVDGSITIPGTTEEFEPLEIITIIVLVANVPFVISGNYMVLQKTDSINGGVFTTRLNVIKVVDMNGNFNLNNAASSGVVQSGGSYKNKGTGVLNRSTFAAVDKNYISYSNSLTDPDKLITPRQKFTVVDPDR